MSATLLKSDPSTGVFFVNFVKVLRKSLLYNTPGRLFLSLVLIRILKSKPHKRFNFQK